LLVARYSFLVNGAFGERTLHSHICGWIDSARRNEQPGTSNE